MHRYQEYFKITVLFLLTSAGLWSCAKVGTLTGGPQDKKSPQQDTLNSTKNYQLRFNDREIVLTFDEWIELKNQNQVLVSPPLKKPPKIEVKGKSVVFSLPEEEVLRDSTTYVINFGNSIVDFNEANPVKDYKFIFSTGDQIDSLSFSGKVIETFTYKPMENITVMLYDSERDSIVLEEVPYYFAKSDKQGEFRINNIKKGLFKCIALEDKDFNYLYNAETEKIGFMDSMILIDGDSTVSAELELFLANPPFRLADKTLKARGKISLKTTQPVEKYELVKSNQSITYFQNFRDSLICWYLPGQNTLDSIYMELNVNDITDTIILKTRNSTPALANPKITGSNLMKGMLYPEDTLKISWSQPITHINHEGILILENVKTSTDKTAQDSFAIDTSLSFTFMKDSFLKHQIWLRGSFNSDKKYKIRFLPGAISSDYGSNDSLYLDFQLEKSENFGTIACHFEKLDSTSQYIVHLTQQNNVVSKKVIRDTSSQTIQFRQLLPGTYKLEVILDHNRNGRWDPGDYFRKLQPEKKMDIALEELRKNWDIETTIKWDKE
ncbi:MAG TPA: Ig-like domain-containing protein [Saprospiraceae bacterium]|nr:Ig-like domain-containing protein [Saprospiraceae bacterium]